MKESNDILKEMLGKRPNELEGETLKLFEVIMKIADERDELKVRNKELEEENKQLKIDNELMKELSGIKRIIK